MSGNSIPDIERNIKDKECPRITFKQMFSAKDTEDSLQNPKETDLTDLKELDNPFVIVADEDDEDPNWFDELLELTSWYDPTESPESRCSSPIDDPYGDSDEEDEIIKRLSAINRDSSFCLST
uniref:Uncharacterized protein n=1 Tax=Panagrolaimus sp. JU765 TaxID=591449 RepID=A0AC34Q707_9BILA